MKIAQIICTFPPYKGGMGNSAFCLARALEKEDCVITTITPLYKNQNITKEKARQKVIRLKPFLQYGNGAFLPQLFFRLKNFDTIYLHYPFFGGAEVVWFFLLFFKKDLIIHYHMDTPQLSTAAKILSLPSRLIRRSLFKKARAVVSASLDYAAQSDIADIYQKNKDKFHEIPFGVDTDKFYPSRTESNQADLNILFVGGLDQAHAFKGVDVLIKAVAKLEPEIPWHLTVVGKGELKTAYQELAEKLGLKNKVEFLDNINNEKLPQIYCQAQVFVLPSIDKNEAFGMVLLEAMASGVPVIASNLPGVRKVFQDQEQGLLIEPKNPEDLKTKLEQILISPEKRKSMGLAARK